MKKVLVYVALVVIGFVAVLSCGAEIARSHELNARLDVLELGQRLSCAEEYFGRREKFGENLRDTEAYAELNDGRICLTEGLRYLDRGDWTSASRAAREGNGSVATAHQKAHCKPYLPLD